MSQPFRKPLARELAMQALFLWDANGETDLELARSAMTGGEGTDPPDDETLRLALSMALGAWEHRLASDPWVERLAPQWPPRRQPGVDRNIIRLAVWEMTHTATPPKVAIDEAIELAKRFSTENSPSFVNGVLDAVLKEIRSLTAAPAVVKQEAGSKEPDEER
jgi:N utilization substance protein B